MKIILTLFFSLILSQGLFASSYSSLQIQKTQSLEKNKFLQSENSQLKATLEKLKKKKNILLGATIFSNLTAAGTITAGILTKNKVNENQKQARNKIKKIKEHVSPTPPPSIIGGKNIVRKDFMDCDVFTIKNKKVKLASSTSTSGLGDEQLLISGPLFEPGGMLTGGYIENGIQTKQWENPSQSRFLNTNFGLKNGIFGQNKDGSFFLHEYKDNTLVAPSNVAWAIQSGPIFRLNGNNHTTGTGKNIRAVIGWNAKNEIIFVMSKKKVSFNRINTVLSSLGVNNALHLDSVNVGWEWNMFTAVVHSGNLISAASLLFY